MREHRLILKNPGFNKVLVFIINGVKKELGIIQYAKNNTLVDFSLL